MEANGCRQLFGCQYFSKYVLLCWAEERNSYWFETWLHFWATVPLNTVLHSQSCSFQHKLNLCKRGQAFPVQSGLVHHKWMYSAACWSYWCIFWVIHLWSGSDWPISLKALRSVKTMLYMIVSISDHLLWRKRKTETTIFFTFLKKMQEVLASLTDTTPKDILGCRLVGC